MRLVSLLVLLMCTQLTESFLGAKVAFYFPKFHATLSYILMTYNSLADLFFGGL